MRTKIMIIFTLVLFVFMNGCNIKTGNSTESTKPAQERRGMALSLVEKKTALTNINFTHRLSSNSHFTPTISLLNKHPESYKYRLFFVLDYEQAEVVYEGKKVSYIDLDIGPYQTETFNVDLAPPGDGLHDFIVVGIRDPDTLLKDSKYIPSGFYFISRRTALVVGNDYTPPSKPFILTEVENTESNTLPFVSHEPRKNFIEEAVTLENGDSENLWLNIPVKTAPTKRAIFILVGTKLYQPMFIETKGSGIAHLPLDLSSYNNHNVTIVIVENPFTLAESKEGDFLNIPWQVTYVNRITIQ